MARVEIWKDGKLVLRQGMNPTGRNTGWWVRLAPHARVRLRIGELASLGQYEIRILESGPNAPDPPEFMALPPSPGPSDSAQSRGTWPRRNWSPRHVHMCCMRPIRPSLLQRVR